MSFLVLNNDNGHMYIKKRNSLNSALKYINKNTELPMEFLMEKFNYANSSFFEIINPENKKDIYYVVDINKITEGESDNEEK